VQIEQVVEVIDDAPRLLLRDLNALDAVEKVFVNNDES
jgi:hypothetical protein